MYFMFEWMARNKATDAASKTAWAMLADVLPEETFPRHFSYAKTILDEYMAGKVSGQLLVDFNSTPSCFKSPFQLKVNLSHIGLTLTT